MLAARRGDLVLLALSAFFLAAHVSFLASTPGSIDAVNFWLGIRDFNLADHRPHAPGYPIFIALGKFSSAVVDVVWPADPAAATVRALAILGAFFGALAVVPLVHFFRGLELNDRRAVAATALTLTCPLFWFTASRPISDVPGLAAGVTAQALLVAAFRRNAAPASAPGMLFAIPALAAGIAIGFRSQNVWLTIPLLIVVLAARRAGWMAYAVAAAAFLLGLAMWAIPLILASGGPGEYLAALSAQGAEDFADADMLVTNPTGGRLATGLIHTFAYPWGSTAFAATTLVVGAVGAAGMLMRARAGMLLLGAAAVPYALFHILFQESTSTRYALPLIPAIAYLTAAGTERVAGRAMPWIVIVLCAAGVVTAFPAVVAYARTGSPTHQAIDEIRTPSITRTTDLVIAAHHAVGLMLRGQELPLPMLATEPIHEWLALVKHWQAAPDTPVWFLAESGRNDLALIDPRSRRLLRSYSWPFRRKFLMARVPSGALDWYEMAPPGWMLGEGWALSPEAAGVATLDRRRPGEHPIVAHVRSRPEAAVLMVGGRNMSRSTGSAARFELAIDGKTIDTWNVTANPGTFFRMWRLPAGALASSARYLPLRLVTTTVDGSTQPVDVAIEQFDLQSENALVYGFDSGWYEQEYDGSTPRPWRWSGRSARVRVHHAGQDLNFRVVGEVPLGYLPRSPRLSVRAGRRVLGEVVAHRAEVDVRLRIPREAIDAAGGYLTIETDQTFIADATMRNGDRRELGLRVYQLELEAAPSLRGAGP